ncbi:hypothetical protein ETAR_16330 [Edwardsiella tarda]
MPIGKQAPTRQLISGYVTILPQHGVASECDAARNFPLQHASSRRKSNAIEGRGGFPPPKHTVAYPRADVSPCSHTSGQRTAPDEDTPHALRA